MSEIELKLAAFPEHIPQFRHALESMGMVSAAPTSTLNSVYYDSADLKLQRQELSLRVGEYEGQHFQTLKSSDLTSGNRLFRGEWEDVIDGDRPDLAAAETGPRLYDVIISEKLRPQFKTIVRRTGDPRCRR